MLREDMITVFGGSGFIGRYVVRELARAGYRVRVAVRRPNIAHELKPMGVPGQIQLVQANLRNRESVERAVEGADGVINLVGILYESGGQSFSGVQARGAALVAEVAAKEESVKSLVHVSAIGADPDSASQYARPKAEGERAVREAFPGAVILRPSIVFGAEDAFFNKFADMARFVPALPLIGGGKTKFQPVFVGDVAEAAVKALESREAKGRIYELGGPAVYSFKELMEYILQVIRRRRILVPVPFAAAHALGLMGEIAGKLPFVQPFLTRDQVELLKRDNVVNANGEGHPGLADLGIDPETVEAVVPNYLARYRRRGQFADEHHDTMRKRTF